MEMRLRAPVTRGYFFLLGALRLVNAASPRNFDQKKISSGTQGRSSLKEKRNKQKALMMFKIRNGMIPAYLEDIFYEKYREIGL